jgi:hypothetical protein
VTARMGWSCALAPGGVTLLCTQASDVCAIPSARNCMDVVVVVCLRKKSSLEYLSTKSCTLTGLVHRWGGQVMGCVFVPSSANG